MEDKNKMPELNILEVSAQFLVDTLNMYGVAPHEYAEYETLKIHNEMLYKQERFRKLNPLNL